MSARRATAVSMRLFTELGRFTTASTDAHTQIMTGDTLRTRPLLQSVERPQEPYEWKPRAARTRPSHVKPPDDS